MSDYRKLRAEYVKLAKMVDQRLVRLEKLASEKGFEAVTKYAYAGAVKEVIDVDKARGVNVSAEGYKPRFNRSIPSVKAVEKLEPSEVKGLERMLKGRIAIMKEFSEKATSTKGRIIDVYEKRAETISKKIDKNVTWQDLQRFYELKKIKKLNDKLGSATVQKIFGSFNEESLTEEEFREALKRNEVVVDEVVDAKIRQAIKSHRLTYKDFFTY